MLTTPIYWVIVNDRLGSLSICLKTKAFGWVLLRSGCLIRSWRLLKNKKKTAKSVTKINVSKIFNFSEFQNSKFQNSKINHKNLSLIPFSLN